MLKAGYNVYFSNFIVLCCRKQVIRLKNKFFNLIVCSNSHSLQRSSFGRCAVLQKFSKYTLYLALIKYKYIICIEINENK